MLTSDEQQMHRMLSNLDGTCFEWGSGEAMNGSVCNHAGLAALGSPLVGVRKDVVSSNTGS